jgi:hypothetical protein
MASSGMVRCVALVITDVSGELSPSIIRVTRMFELRTTLAATRNRHTLRSNRSIASYGKRCSYVRFEVFTAVTMKNGVFWVVTPCGSYKNNPEDTILQRCS